MNCEKCQELLRDFFDGSLSGEDRRTLGAHLEECLSCTSVRDELDSIIGFCREHRGEYAAPPNPQALWLRIRNMVEAENAGATRAAQASTRADERRSWLSRLMNRHWDLSLPQLATAVSAIAVAVALATTFSVQRFRNASMTSAPSATSGSVKSGEPGAAMAYVSLDDRVRDQQLGIDYWEKRVNDRMAHWSPQRREAFQKNMQIIDQAVQDSLKELHSNPHDEVSEELLNAALNDKMELLKEFADL